MCDKKNPIQEIIDKEKLKSGITELTLQQTALKVSNATKKGVPLDNDAWNKGKKMPGKNANYGKDGSRWAKTRKQRASTMTEDQRRKYYGIKDEHSEQTKQKMSESASLRWRRSMRKVHTDDGVFDNIMTCAEHYGIHKDTVVYRIKATSPTYQGWHYEDTE